MISASDLIVEHIKINDFVTAETKKFTEHLAPHKKRMEEIQNLLLGLLNDHNTNAMSTDHGTAYISEIMTPKIVDRDAYLDFVLDHKEMLQLREPQKEALRDYISTHQHPPPGVDVSYFNRLNIRRS